MNYDRMKSALSNGPRTDKASIFTTSIKPGTFLLHTLFHRPNKTIIIHIRRNRIDEGSDEYQFCGIMFPIVQFRNDFLIDQDNIHCWQIIK